MLAALPIFTALTGADDRVAYVDRDLSETDRRSDPDPYPEGHPAHPAPSPPSAWHALAPNVHPLGPMTLTTSDALLVAPHPLTRGAVRCHRAHAALRHDKLPPPDPTGADRMFVPLSAAG